MRRYRHRRSTEIAPALLAAALVLGAGATAALAQGSSQWVDPPANLSQPANSPPAAPARAAEEPARPPAPKAEAPAPQPAKAAAKPAAPEKPAVAEKPAAAKKPARQARARPVREVTERQVTERQVIERQVTERKRTAARPERPARRAVASRSEPRPVADPVARTRELQVMRLRTLEFPDGRRVDVLTPLEEDVGGWPFR